MKNNIKQALAGLQATETHQGLPIPGRDMVENNAGGFRSLRKPLGDGFIFNPNQPAIKCNNTKPALTGTT